METTICENFILFDAIERILLIVLRNALKRCDGLNRSDSLLRWNTLEIIIPGSFIVSSLMLIFIFYFKAMEIFHTTLMRIIVRVFILLFAEKKKRRRIKPRNKRYNGIFIILDIY